MTEPAPRPWWRRARTWQAAALAALVIGAAGLLVALSGSPDPGTRPSRRLGTAVMPSDCPSPTARPARRPAPSATPVRGVEFDKAKKALQKNRDEIFKRYRGVQGMGIGAVTTAKKPDKKPDKKSFGILVFVQRPDDRPTTPQEVDGVPLEFRVSGRVGALHQLGC